MSQAGRQVIAFGASANIGATMMIRVALETWGQHMGPSLEPNKINAAGLLHAKPAPSQADSGISAEAIAKIINKLPAQIPKRVNICCF